MSSSVPYNRACSTPAEAQNRTDIGPLGVLGRRFRSNAPRAPSPVATTKTRKEMIMKKAFTLVVLIVTPTMAFAQGTVAFNNQTGLVTSYPALPKSGGSVELIAAPQGTPLPNPLGTYVWQDLRPYFIPNYSSLSGFLAANPGWEP